MIYGGVAGGGKSYGLLLSPLRHKNVSGLGYMIKSIFVATAGWRRVAKK